MILNFSHRSRPLALCALLMLCLGLWLLIGGLWLAVLGGARFYLLAGVAMVVAAGLLLAGRRGGAGLYMATLGCTVIWAVTEVGTDIPALWSRLWLPVALGLWLLVAGWRSARQ